MIAYTNLFPKDPLSPENLCWVYETKVKHVRAGGHLPTGKMTV